ncbi:MAG: F0F1 ATP synthase subunit gamma, partial [Candidatus Omnitrophica bacterium]|nr:F0F1 ATP synthase subunit gamma [Candidatus Omnitrophota bacterium]
LMESRLSEELSRMLAMKYATENGEEMVSNLTLKYHRARQAQITTEILEIIQGVEV